MKLRDAYEIVKVLWIIMLIALAGVTPFAAIAAALYWWCK